MNKDAYNSAITEYGKLRDAEKFSEAIVGLKKLTKNAPDWPAAHLVLGHVLWEKNRLEEAKDSFTRAIAISPKLETASLGKFHTLWDSNQFEEALAEIRRFLSVSESSEYLEILKNLNQTID